MLLANGPCLCIFVLPFCLFSPLGPPLEKKKKEKMPRDRLTRITTAGDSLVLDGVSFERELDLVM